jgi:RND family efflux transporter MFP subunit
MITADRGHQQGGFGVPKFAADNTVWAVAATFGPSGAPVDGRPNATASSDRSGATQVDVASDEWRPKGEVTVLATDGRFFRRYCGLALVALVALAGCKKQNAFVAPPPPHVGVAHALQQEVTPYLELTGNAQAVNQVDLVARVQGFLQEIDYQDGAVAKQGDTLFVIEPAPYQARLQQAQAALASAQAQLAQTAAEYKRQASLGRTDFSSQSQVEVALAAQQTNQANVDNQQAGLTQAAINLGYTRVTAPFDGQVEAHQVSIGSLVGVSGPTVLATIVQLDPIRVIGSISEQDVLRIKDTMPKRAFGPAEIAKVPIEVGRMDETGYPHRGALDYVSPAIDTNTGTLTLRGILTNADRALLPGMFVRMRIPMTPQKSLALLVPDIALGSDQGGRYLLVVDKDDIVQQRPVRTGSAVGDLRVITSGLAAEDRVVVSGLQKASPGAKVVPNEVQIAGPPSGGQKP